MISRLKAGSQERQEHLQQALETIASEAIDINHLKKKIAASRTTWLVADLVTGINEHYPPPPLPDSFTVLAADGSQIDVDRHRAARCYLINIGSVALSYGDQADATLDSLPRLYSGDEDLVMTSPDGHEQLLEGALLGIKRAVEECRHLASLATRLPAATTALALIDGSLILWGLTSKEYPAFVTEALLDRGFLSYLDEMKGLNRARSLAIASYISFPRSTDVVNTLRIALCPNQAVDTDRCSECPTRECEKVGGVLDREVFASLLNPGERSALFGSQSSINRTRYREHRVHFFYLKVAEETARVEIPEWVAMDKSLLELTHRLVLDQCRRGQGYPVALSEAHEQAVVTGADRENFWQLVESSLREEKMPATGSAKSLSKRTRWV